MSIDQLSKKGQLMGNEKLTDDELDMLLELEEEESRRGNFERIFPLSSSINHYSKFFETVRYPNELLKAYLNSSKAAKTQLISKHK